MSPGRRSVWAVLATTNASERWDRQPQPTQTRLDRDGPSSTAVYSAPTHVLASIPQSLLVTRGLFLKEYC